MASDKALHYCCMYKKMDTARSILSSSASAVVPPEKFHPNKSFPFPKRSSRSKGEARSFRPEWCEKYSWLHYDAGTDAAFCFICMKTETEKKFKSIVRNVKLNSFPKDIRTGKMHAKLLKSTPTVNVIRNPLKALGYL